jgi:hypothetical protein
MIELEDNRIVESAIDARFITKVRLYVIAIPLPIFAGSLKLLRVQFRRPVIVVSPVFLTTELARRPAPTAGSVSDRKRIVRL